MSEPIDYAEMLEIPVSTLNVTKKRSRKKKESESDLKDKVVEKVNRHAETMDEEPGYASERIATEENVVEYGASEEYSEPQWTEKSKKKFLDSKLLLAEFIAVCVLCATILLTNLFWQNSAINTFFRGLVTEETPVTLDERNYSELTLGAVVSDSEIECTVTDAGVLTFTGACSVYAPFGGTVRNVTEADGVYTIEIEHTTSFSSVITGLTYAYCAAGDTVFATIPVGYTDGSGEVAVSMYDDGAMIRTYSVNENNDIVWNV